MYDPDLAFIHDTGFADYALKSAPEILRILNRDRAHGELVIDLGCGSGLVSSELLKAGYQVLGLDISPAMVKIARAKAPGAKFAVQSVYEAELPECAAIISISECLNYISEGRNHRRDLSGLFRKIYHSLKPGGVFIFDLAVPGQVPQGQTVTVFSEASNWLILVAKHEDQGVLTRRIVTFREFGGKYRRSEEVHRQALYPSAEIATELRRTGFTVRVSRHYGGFKLPKARAAFVARKPRLAIGKR